MKCLPYIKAFLLPLTLVVFGHSVFAKPDSVWVNIDTMIVAQDFPRKNFLWPNDMVTWYPQKVVWDDREARVECNFFRTGSDDLFQTSILVVSEIWPVNIGISINEKGSKVWLKNIDPAIDTIRINKWLLQKNCLRDSIWGDKVLFLYDSGQIAKTLSLTAINKITNVDCNTRLRSYSFTLNNQSYTIPLRIETQDIISYEHGFPSRRDMRKGQERRTRHRRLYISTTTREQLYYGELDLGE